MMMSDFSRRVLLVIRGVVIKAKDLNISMILFYPTLENLKIKRYS